MIIKDKIKIPFHLCDPAKILFFGSLYEIYHQFLENHIEDFDIKWTDWFKGEIGTPIRGLKTSYNAPLFFGEVYDATLKVTALSDSKVTFNFTLGPQNKPRAVTEVTHCFINTENGEKSSIPNKIKSSFSKYLTTD